MTPSPSNDSNTNFLKGPKPKKSKICVDSLNIRWGYRENLALVTGLRLKGTTTIDRYSLDIYGKFWSSERQERRQDRDQREDNSAEEKGVIFSL